jgi:hypothetical protein
VKIKQQDWEYGAVLHQIVMHPVFTAINKVTDKAGLYLINKRNPLLIKCSNDEGPTWSFALSHEDISAIVYPSGHLALNCGSQTVCLLDYEQVETIVDPDATQVQVIKVGFNRNESMRVVGPRGKLGRTVPHNAFPSEIFGRVDQKREAYAWPELSRLQFYRAAPEPMFTSMNRLLDLSDSIGPASVATPTIVYMGVSSISHKWPVWNEDRLQAIENQIKYDLSFDGYKVKVQRHTPAIDPVTKKKDRPCADEFVWKLTIQ